MIDTHTTSPLHDRFKDYGGNLVVMFSQFVTKIGNITLIPRIKKSAFWRISENMLGQKTFVQAMHGVIWIGH
ncbi:Uncharacterised protein [Vibrio cholerae]|uniref:Uncharacterized protein n=1 Tax=Vibrio cholerae TaxID=666 RepID=A0A655QJ34_VIBCL|nr:Uncharacterised protein [Vibrio cholerae]CSA13333.1 Uncharacterised protein [Vibrio cholerae]CSA56795.1 Uncharacterised protein [Vibrio cholerae]CSB27884.1 Uncharacterised protein [Vibrio cholerae]CSB47129.1 Uncharacterised protein [Vibrio cholerae]